MRYLKGGITFVLFINFSIVYAFWDMVWEDDFNGDHLNEDNWVYDYECGGNDELQCYTNKITNVKVESGHLTIHAHVEPYESMNYTSGKLMSRKSWAYGKYEIRARLTKGKHLWPAFWMLPDIEMFGIWPASGEIDIVEYRGQEVHQIEGTIHYGGPYPDNTYSGSGEKTFDIDFSDDWHVFALEWDQNEMKWFVDNKQYHKESINRSMWSGKGKNPYWKDGQPFDQPFYVILNIAVGGSYFPEKDFGSLTIEEAKQWFKPTMDVDFIKVYKWK